MDLKKNKNKLLEQEETSDQKINTGQGRVINIEIRSDITHITVANYNRVLKP